MSLSPMDPTLRLKRLADIAQEFNLDKNQPIRRYYRSGAEMLKMGNVYYREENYEKAYVLYHKYLTLFVEKIREHPEYKTFPTSEKTRATTHVMTIMQRCEKIKGELKQRFEREFIQFKRIEEERRVKEEEERRRKEAEERQRAEEAELTYKKEKEKRLAEMRDHETAVFYQIQADKEYEKEQLEQAIRKSQLDQSGGGSLPEIDRERKPSASNSVIQPTIPSLPDRSLKPSSLYTSDDHIRPVSLSPLLMAKFLSIAQMNTENNVETCGVLAGKLERNQFHITHLLIPKQKGTSDSCTTSGEEEIFEYQDKHDLITLGWIHTHPSQTAFLSSVDLHTHHSYQLMLPEAVAIVCAPKYNQTGFFTLTQNHGLGFIGRCREDGFHPHPKEPPLFEEAAHVHLNEDSDVVLIDLR